MNKSQRLVYEFFCLSYSQRECILQNVDPEYANILDFSDESRYRVAFARIKNKGLFDQLRNEIEREKCNDRQRNLRTPRIR